MVLRAGDFFFSFYFSLFLGVGSLSFQFAAYQIEDAEHLTLPHMVDGLWMGVSTSAVAVVGLARRVDAFVELYVIAPSSPINSIT